MAHRWEGRSDEDRIAMMEDIIKRRHYGEELHRLCRGHGISAQTFYNWSGKKFKAQADQIYAALPELSEEGNIVERLPVVLYDFDLYDEDVSRFKCHSPLFSSPDRCCNDQRCNLRQPGLIPEEMVKFKAHQLVFGLFLQPKILDAATEEDVLSEADRRAEWLQGMSDILEQQHRETVIKVYRQEALKYTQALLTMGWGSGESAQKVLEENAVSITLQDLESLDPSRFLPAQDIPGLCVAETFLEPMSWFAKQRINVEIISPVIPESRHYFIFTDGTKVKVHLYRFVALRGVGEFHREA